MPPKVYDWRSIMATHQPVIWAVAEHCAGPIVEFGAGHCSTPSLHAIAERRGLRLLSLETDPSWLERFRYLESDFHELRLVESWEEELERPQWDEQWGMVFVDQLPWEWRAPTVNRVRKTAEYVVLHDCSAAPDHGLGRRIREVNTNGSRDLGERDFDAVFSSWREFFPPQPWPHKTEGPPTLLGSNLRDTREVDVDFVGHLPMWWRVARHFRGLVPQRIKMRIANQLGWRIRRGLE
jgi:hypothetical protein